MGTPTFRSGGLKARVEFDDGWVSSYQGDRVVRAHLTPQEAITFASVLTQYGRRPAPAHRVTEPHVDRYFNGGDDVDDDETFPERLARFAEISRKARESAVLVEHTGPYRSIVTFGALS